MRNEPAMAILRGKIMVLGVCGGIAAYKSAELIRLLIKQGVSVQVVMTVNATHFITPLTLQVLSDRPVCVDLFDRGMETEIGHIQVARGAQAAVIAPATANVIAKLAAGIADDYLTTVMLAVTSPVLICPAMNSAMYMHPATRRNLDILRGFGHAILEPECGELACKEQGPGRLPEPATIVEALRRLLTAPSLAGKKVLVSAGPTWEAFDPARFITNPSSGKMGYALAAEAARRQAEVELVSGPSALTPAPGITCHRVTSAAEMNAAITSLAATMDIVVMSAAVSDYRPAVAAPRKLKKDDRDLTVRFERTPDILAGMGQRKTARQVLVGFAAETENLLTNATEKLRRKNCDLIVANDLTEADAGFATDTNRVKVIYADGRVEPLPCISKTDLAALLWDRIEAVARS